MSATFMQIFCRYCRPCCSYAAVLQQICDRYLQTFYIYVSLAGLDVRWSGCPRLLPGRAHRSYATECDLANWAIVGNNKVVFMVKD